MKRVIVLFALIAACSCSQLNEDGLYKIGAQKKAWISADATKAPETVDACHDVSWKVGEKVLLLASDQSFEGLTRSWEDYDEYGNSLGGGTVTDPAKGIICTVSKADSLKCTLVTDSTLVAGTYRAFYPAYDYAYYDRIHLSFLYEKGLGLDSSQQDIVISDPVVYEEGQELSFVMNHICALLEINLYPPRDGEYKLLKLVADATVFPGKATFLLDEESDLEEYAAGWVNFTTLRVDEKTLKEGEVLHTTTGLLPYQYNRMPVTVHLVYPDGTHYVSEPFAMPSLNYGVKSTVEVKELKQTDAPLQGYWGRFFGDKSTDDPYDIIH